MSILEDEVPVSQDGAWFATVATSAGALSDLIEVVIPAFSTTHRWGPCRWQSRDDTSLPARGDQCLVIFDDKRQPWIVSWWPFS